MLRVSSHSGAGENHSGGFCHQSGRSLERCWRAANQTSGQAEVARDRLPESLLRGGQICPGSASRVQLEAHGNKAEAQTRRTVTPAILSGKVGAEMKGIRMKLYDDYRSRWARLDTETIQKAVRWEFYDYD